MLSVIDVASFLCAACAILSVVQLEPILRLPEWMMKPRRRSSLWRGAAWLGRVMPLRGRQGEALRERLIYTGSKITTQEFLGLKLLATLGGCLGAFVIARELGPVSLSLLMLGAGVGFVIPDLWLRSRITKRQRAIVRLLPEVIDLLSLCIGAGLEFLLALNKVATLPRFKGEPLIDELSLALQEIKLGRRRAEALRALATRVNLPELSSFIRTVVQADRMGTPIAEALGRHSEDLRLQRFMRAERAALQAPIKILVPLIFCIMPCVALLVGAPIFLQFMRQNPFR